MDRAGQRHSGLPWIHTTGLVLTLMAAAGTLAGAFAGDAPLGDHGDAGAPALARITCAVPVDAPQITRAGQDDVAIPGFGRLLISGQPNLPSRIFAIAIPPGAEAVGVTCELGEPVTLPGTFRVAPVPQPRVIGAERPELYARDRAIYEANYAAVYGSDEPYPAEVVALERTAGLRQYNLVDVRVSPMQYRPQSGTLVYYPDLTIHVDYRPAAETRTAADFSPRAERLAERIILNHAQAQAWQAPLDPAGGRYDQYDYVIITLPELVDAVAPLVEWESIRGHEVTVVTTSWIELSYPGVDLAAKIRSFLRDKYPLLQWGIEYVLLVGDYDDVPMRRTWQDQGYGKPETDFYYAELSLPDSDSWDDDGDQHWGEDSDPIDMYAEVVVGRIPWSDPLTVASICAKSVAYEQNEDPAFKKNMLLLGAFYWSDTDNAVLMEAKINQLWMTDWTFTRMYEQNGGAWSDYDCDYPLNHANVMNIWPEGTYAFVNWAGHGSPTACYIMGGGAPHFIASSDCAALNDDYPAIIFAAACSNSDTDHLNIGKAMLAQGSVGFLGATKVAYGYHDWDNPYDGATASFDYFFTTCVTSQQYSQGEAVQWGLTEMYTHGLWYYDYYETFEWSSIWGNPALGMGPPPFLRLVPVDLPPLVPPREPTLLTVRIYEGTEAVVAGSAQMLYRLDGGAWQTVPLEPVEGELWQAQLPAPTCLDHPEFYFTVEGTTSGPMVVPEGAPDVVFSAQVATVTTHIADDGELDTGWTVESLELESGAWVRVVPAGDGTRGDPVSDFDGSGRCFLTGNGLINDDVDGGPTRLVSATLDLSGTQQPVLEYARWFTNDDEDEDYLRVEVSNSDGMFWTMVDDADVEPDGWVTKQLVLTDHLVMTDAVKIRFSTADNPNNSITEAAVDAIYLYDIACHANGSGDMNCDSAVDFKDINAFVLALSDAAAWQAVYPDCDLINGDINGDGEFGFKDINPFVLLLSGR